MPVPEQTYYPGCRLRLVVRFDEFGATDVQQSAPRKPQTVLRGIKSQRNPLVVQPDTSIPNVRRFVLSPAGSSTATGGPQDQDKSSDERTHAIVGIIPKSATWNANGIRVASTLSAKIKYVDVPFDPRIVRACAVEGYFGTVTAEDYARGVAGETRLVGTNGAEPLNLIPEQYTDEKGNQRTNLRFQGFVDKWEINWDDEEEPIVSIECRDNTQLLIDQEAPPALVISAQKPIDEAIADYLSNFATFSGLTVEYRPNTATPPTLGGALAGTAFQPKLGPAPARGGGASSKLSVWDYITDVVGALGHVVYIDGTTIIVTQARSLLSNTTTRRTDDPFTGRSVDGDEFQYRRFIWGRNVQKMRISRNYSRKAPSNVEVRAYSPRRKKDLVIRFPDPSSQRDKLQVKGRPGDGGTDQKWIVYRIRGIEDSGTLRVIAENIYQTVGRNELELDLTTKNLASFGGGNLDPDILDMRVGDTFELLVARDDDFGTIGQVENSLANRTQAFMEQLGFAPELATAYAKAYSDAGFQTLFRLKAMSIDWDGEGDDGGMTMQIRGANYVEVRADAPNK